MKRNWVYNLRKEIGVSQDVFADMNHVSRRTVCNWELGATRPDIKDLFWMKNKLNLPVDIVKSFR